MALSKKQYAVLADLSLKAWGNQPPEVRLEAERAASAARNDPLVSLPQIREHWRKSWQLKVIGKESMADATNADFLKLKSLWLELAGDINGALRATAKDMDHALNQARVILERETRAAELAWPEYPEAIVKRQYGKTLAELGPKQLWYAIYTVRNRAKAKRDKAAVTHPEPPRDEPPIVEPDGAPQEPPLHPDADESGNWW